MIPFMEKLWKGEVPNMSKAGENFPTHSIFIWKVGECECPFLQELVPNVAEKNPYITSKLHLNNIGTFVANVNIIGMDYYHPENAPNITTVYD